MLRSVSRHTGAALLLAAVLAGAPGCGASNSTVGPSGSIALSLSPTSATRQNQEIGRPTVACG